MTGAGRCLVVPKEIVASVERDGGTPMEIFHDPVVRGVSRSTPTSPRCGGGAIRAWTRSGLRGGAG